MSEKPQRIVIDISWDALFKVVGLAVILWAVVFLREILLMILGIFIFVAAVNPTISKLQKYMSRTVAVTVFYIGIIFFAAFFLLILVPPLVTQVKILIRSFPTLLTNLQPYLGGLETNQHSGIIEQALNSLSNNLERLSNNLLQTIVTFFGGVATLFTALVVSFYLLLEEKNAQEFFHQVLPQHRFEAVYDTVSKISERMGSWVRGQLLLMAIIGLANLLAYLVLGVPVPLPLALWAGLCEAIPYIGPILGFLPAALLALATGDVLQALLVVIVSIGIIQQLEGHIVVPKVMSKAVGLSPVLVIFSLLVGAKLFGLMGAIIAVPAAAIISVIVGEWSNLSKIWEGDE